MLGSSKLTALLGSAPTAYADSAVLKAYAKSLQKDGGLSLFLVVPGGKEPVDCRTTAAKNKDIREAAEAGRVKPTGLHMATANPTHLAKWIDKYRKDREQRPEFSGGVPVNFAMEVGRSRVIIVDVDTVAELNAFRTYWAEASGDPNLQWVAPTVSSPGVQDDTGNWIHQGGGHFYFTVPDDVDLSGVAPGSITPPVNAEGASYTIYWRDRYVLIPPSTRKEGTYWVSGTDHPAPEWLLTLITGRGAELAARAKERQERTKKLLDAGEVDGITAWGDQTEWSDILEAANWVNSGRVDSCTCEIWTRPGNPANTKSATVHSSGCADERFDPLNPPIHIWSDNIEGDLAAWVGQHGKTLSKLQFVAANHHKGDVAAAMAALGIRSNVEHTTGDAMSADDLRKMDADLSAPIKDRTKDRTKDRPKAADPVVEVEVVNLSPAGVFSDPAGYSDTASSEPAEASDTASSETAEDEDEADSDAPYRPVFANFNHWRDLPAPRYIVDGWVEDRALSAVIGPPGAGKSAVVLDMACSIAMGVPWQGKATVKNRVLYIAGEGGTGAAMRVKAWEQAHGLDVGEELFMLTEAVLVASGCDLWDWLSDNIVENDIHLVIFDTLARMSLGLEENSSTDMGRAVSRFDRLRRETDTGVMVVHHTTRGQTHGRGSTAILGALDSEILVQPPEDDENDDKDSKYSKESRGDAPGKRLVATVTKQKNAEDGVSVDLTLCQRHDSIIVADAYGNIVDSTDPFAAPVIEFKRPADESPTDLAIRLAQFLDTVPVQGGTVSDMARAVTPSRGLRNNAAGWRSAVIVAKDRGLATGLIQTFGPDGSQRFIRGNSTESQAKALDRAEADDKVAQ